MGKISLKTLSDLEFPTVREQVAEHCQTGPGIDKARELAPVFDTDLLQNTLKRTSEYLSSFTNENRIPGHSFEDISTELKYLGIENMVPEVSGFQKIAILVKTALALKKFFKKFKTYYPLLHERVDILEENKEIGPAIDAVIDRFGEIRDNASPQLKEIRKQMQLTRSRINKSFSSALSSYSSADYLDEIRESVVENRRVLAVKAMYRKKVKGQVLGTSKTGSIAFIEPEAVLKYSRELNNLEYDEKEEIRRVLKELTDTIRPYRDLLGTYQDYLAETDLTAAKAKYARQMNALLPKLNSEKKLFLRDAYHPLLYLTNEKSGEKTWPQTIHLHTENRIMVISGPNAGGKSITLKTIGLLQLMLQSGLLVPVHERSSMCLYDRILTDIGDNQSIENHLSTYSYRLKNMRGFLKTCDSNTLFLIDEFGTGSDPELGGALAEAMLEVFYERGSYGVITTHYSNLKVLADELPHATNANMLFDSRTLQPTFRLETGQPGSSFTFEVAEQNGIPYSLINKAKKKIERGKVRFDATIARMQKERSRMQKTGTRLEQEEVKAREEARRLEDLNTRLKSKLQNYQELYDYNQRMIHLGNKVNKAAEGYFQSGKKRPLISELLRIVETENSKRKVLKKEEQKAENARRHKASQEVMKEIKVVRKEKKKAKQQKKEKPKPRPVFQVGDRVRLTDGKAVGSIDSLEKNKATVNYGQFTTNVSVDQLELVEAIKK